MSDFGIPSLDTNIAGCVSKAGYSYILRPAMDRLPALRGRPRYRLKGLAPSFEVSVTVEMDNAQFSAWQAFWAGPVEKGAKPFVMRLTMDAALIFSEQDEAYVVQATGPWNATRGPNDRWQVAITLEVPAAIAYQITICDVIYGGPITDLATDDIWAGHPGDLPPDVITPCSEVLQ